jgi:hypothetical protein
MEDDMGKPAEGVRAYKAIFLWALLFAVVTMVASLVVIFAIILIVGGVGGLIIDGMTQGRGFGQLPTVLQSSAHSLSTHLDTVIYMTFLMAVFTVISTAMLRRMSPAVVSMSERRQTVYGALTVLVTMGSAAAMKTFFS